MSHPWYNTTDWRKRRASQLAREPLCRMCLELGYTTPATVADHVEPHKGDSDRFWRGELQSLCDTHHNSTKQADEARGYSVAVGADGLPVDPRHPARYK